MSPRTIIPFLQIIVTLLVILGGYFWRIMTKIQTICIEEAHITPWLVWLSWLEHGTIKKGLGVQFPVGAHAKDTCSIPGPDVYNPWAGHIQEVNN